MATTTLRSALLPVVDVLRGIPGQFGLRLFTVAVFSRVYSGARPGIGPHVDTSTGLKVDLGLFPTKITMLRSDEIIASGGLYLAQDIRVGPITPPFPGSNIDNDAISVFEPPRGATGFELGFNITGPGYPATGAWFKKISQSTEKSFRYTFVLRATGKNF